MKKLLEDFLRHAASIVPTEHVARAVILRPDFSHDYLASWESYQMPLSSLEAMRFDIRPVANGRKSVAAQTFLDGEMRLVQFQAQQEGEPNIQKFAQGHWVTDTEAVYEPHERSSQSRYESFVVLPIHTSTGRRLGVICLDSQEREAFSNVDLVPSLSALVIQARVAIETYVSLQQQQQSDDTLASVALTPNHSAYRWAV